MMTPKGKAAYAKTKMMAGGSLMKPHYEGAKAQAKQTKAALSATKGDAKLKKGAPDIPNPQDAKDIAKAKLEAKMEEAKKKADEAKKKAEDALKAADKEEWLAKAAEKAKALKEKEEEWLAKVAEKKAEAGASLIKRSAQKKVVKRRARKPKFYTAFSKASRKLKRAKNRDPRTPNQIISALEERRALRALKRGLKAQQRRSFVEAAASAPPPEPVNSAAIEMLNGDGELHETASSF